MRFNCKFITLFIGLFVCLLSSCTKEDVIKDNDLLRMLLTNQWVGSEDEFNEYESGNVEYRTERYRFLFFEDGWGYSVWFDKSIDLDGTNRNEEAFSFTYRISGNTVSIRTELSRVYADFQYIDGCLIDESSDMLLKPSSMTEGQKMADMEKWFPTKGSCGDNVIWKYDRSTKTLTISGNGGVQSYEYKPRPWEDYEIETLIYEEGVTATGPYDFYKKQIPNIILSSTIKQISKYSFSDNRELLSIDIPNSCWAIYEGAFEYCHKLETIKFDGNSSMKDSKLQRIGNSAFSTSGLDFEILEFPKSMRIIGEYAFFHLGIKKIILNEGLENIGDGAFADNAIENELIIPESLKKVNGGFEGSFNKVIIKSDYTSIEHAAFRSSSETGDVYIYKTKPGKDDYLNVSTFVCGPDFEDIVGNWILHVPIGSKQYYEKEYAFKKFGKIVEENY